MHLSSDKVLIAMEIDYEDYLKATDIENLNSEIEKKIKTLIPEAEIYLEASNPQI